MRLSHYIRKCMPLAIAALLLTGSINVLAASANVSFSDPEGKVGDTVSVNILVESDGALGDAQITITYDTEYLEYTGGEGTSLDGAGTVVFYDSGDSVISEMSGEIEFTALKAGETELTVSGTEVYAYGSEDVLSVSTGSSLVTIEAADDGTTEISAGKEITIDDATYTISSGYEDLEIPDGYEEGETTYDGDTAPCVTNESGVILLWLMDEYGDGTFYYYDGTDLYPYVSMMVSDTTDIILLDADVSLPDEYVLGNLYVEDYVYPYWTDPDGSGCGIVYALNERTNETGFYRYDKDDGSYQAYEIEEEGTYASYLPDSLDPVMDPILEFINDDPELAVLFAAAIFIVLFLIILVNGIKLRRRNRELDYVCAEYGIIKEESEE